MKNDKIYYVTGDYDYLHPELTYKASQSKFKTLKEARAYAKKYVYSKVFRVYHDGQWFVELKKYRRRKHC